MTLHPLVIPHLVEPLVRFVFSLSWAVIIPVQVQQGFSTPFLKGHLISQPSLLLFRTTYQAMGPCLICGIPVLLSPINMAYKHGHSHCSFPLYPWNAGKSLLDLPGWQHLSSFWSTPAPAIFEQVHPSLHSWEQIPYQPYSTEKITPEIRNVDGMSSGFNSSPPQRNTTRTTWRAKKTGNGEPGRRGQPGEGQRPGRSEVIWDCHNLSRLNPHTGRQWERAATTSTWQGKHSR